MTVIRIKTWVCPSCDYHQDYEPTKANHAIHFPELRLDDDLCPACASGKNPSRIKAAVEMVRETRQEKLVTITILDEAAVDSLIARGESLTTPAQADAADALLEATKKPARRSLSPAEKQQLKARIRADEARFRALEHK